MSPEDDSHPSRKTLLLGTLETASYVRTFVTPIVEEASLTFGS